MNPFELNHPVVVVGADTTAVRLVEELVRAGEQLVVIAHGQHDASVLSRLQRLGAEVVITARVEEVDLARAGVERAKVVVILGDDDVLAVRVALVIEEMRPGCRLVLEMSNPTLGRSWCRCSATARCCPGRAGSTGLRRRGPPGGRRRRRRRVLRQTSSADLPHREVLQAPPMAGSVRGTDRRSPAASGRGRCPLRGGARW